ncbi:Beta-site APP-cleaving enzyme [Stylosanthes scabra]|uniref:Beta-site APP-cleaving enzyme n=1 Tax=Stylosanthes scabra TaxID=79078 RepID=A0ABU6UEV4_9FABA|nr:Beta-site APP-cleaving enzyme [Stylosanthes scabra]
MPLESSSHNNSDISFNNNDGFSIPLIHRDSPLSPSYNHSKTPLESRISQLKHSISRMNYLSSLLHKPQKISLPISYDPASYLYITSFYIGTPPTKVFGFVDTASDIIWTNSKRAFNRLSSSSFIFLTCNDKNYCKKLGDDRRTCKKGNDPCTYRNSYMDKSSTTGVISQDKFRFDASKDLGTVTFGYANDPSSEHFTGKDINGCLGLSRAAPFSLITQLEIKKFSHCLIKDGSKSSTMRFGSEAVINSENSTPLLDDPRLYYVQLKGINVGEKKVEGTVRQFGTIYVDTGSSYSMLKETVFTPFLKLVKELVPKTDVVPASQYDKDLEFCFKATSRCEGFAKGDVSLHQRRCYFRERCYLCGFCRWNLVSCDYKIP